MSRYEFRLPDIGEGTAEAECVGWHVRVGDRVEEDQPLVDVMTDKATVEVTSPITGTVLELHGSPGTMLPVGSVVIVFEALSEADVASSTTMEPGPPALTTVDGADVHGKKSAGRVLTSPAVRQRAKDHGIDLRSVHGTGPQGRVRQFDLDTFLSAQNAVTKEVRPLSASQLTTGDDKIIEVPVIGLRRRIAERMQDTKRRIPHFSYIEEVDMTALERARVALNQRYADRRGKLTMLPFLMRAIAQTLPDFPHLNALFDDEARVVRHYRAFHCGIATQTPAGLVVTVVRDVGGRDLWDLAAEISRLSESARSGRAAAADLNGSTLTVTSLGALGGLATTPVINSPEVAIVGVNKMSDRAVVREGTIGVAKIMNLSSSFDHRVVDGWDAANFIQNVRMLLEEPALLVAG